MNLIPMLGAASIAVLGTALYRSAKKRIGQGTVTGTPTGGFGGPPAFGSAQAVIPSGIPFGVQEPVGFAQNPSINPWAYYRDVDGQTQECYYSNDPSKPDVSMICTPVKYPVTYGYNGWGV